MNIDQFKEQYKHLRDVDRILVDDLCNYPGHIKLGKDIGKGPAKRNILKHGGKEFICRDCYMAYDNPMNHVGEKRQTDEEITVICPHPDHKGSPTRKMKKSCYYGEMKEPYLQICGSCSQLGRVFSDEQKEKISEALTGRELSADHKSKILKYREDNPDWAKKAISNLIPGIGGGWNKNMETPQVVRDKIAIANKGKKRTLQQRANISEGRKKMLAETGGFTREHREKLSQATKRNYEKGFDPTKYHRKGWHISQKAGKVFYHSSYEKKAFEILDKDDKIRTYKTENIKLPYFNPVSKIKATYFVDVEAEYTNGLKIIIEVKPERWLNDEVVMAKTEAGYLYALENDVEYEIWTELKLFGPIYDERKIRTFIESLDSPERVEKKKERNRQKARKHYQEKIATNTIEFWCDYCQENHIRQRDKYEENVEKNGRFICIKENGAIVGKRSRKKKESPYGPDKKKCTGPCGRILSLECFSKGKAKCKECRTAFYKEQYHKKG